MPQTLFFKIIPLAILTSACSQTLTPQDQRLFDLNKRVNTEIVYTPDAPGKQTLGAVNDRGDCEDYVIRKQAYLFKSGAPSIGTPVLCMADGVAHMVLKVGPWYLDNRFDELTKEPQCKIIK